MLLCAGWVRHFRGFVWGCLCLQSGVDGVGDIGFSRVPHRSPASAFAQPTVSERVLQALLAWLGDRDLLGRSGRIGRRQIGNVKVIWIRMIMTTQEFLCETCSSRSHPH